MKKRKPNEVSQIFGVAANLKSISPCLSCCDCIGYTPLYSTTSGFGPEDLDRAKRLFDEIFNPHVAASKFAFWWASPPRLGEDKEDPDFEARMLALLLAELIAMEGGL